MHVSGVHFNIVLYISRSEGWLTLKEYPCVGERKTESEKRTGNKSETGSETGRERESGKERHRVEVAQRSLLRLA